MKANEKIVKFMQGKADRLKEFDIKSEYFNTEDKNAILKWTSAEAEQIWNMMKFYIENHDIAGLNANACPFCIKYNICISVFSSEKECLRKGCEYETNHGSCLQENTILSQKKCDFQKVTYEIKNLYGNDYQRDVMFTNKFYRNLIKEIIDVEKIIEEIKSENICNDDEKRYRCVFCSNDVDDKSQTPLVCACENVNSYFPLKYIFERLKKEPRLGKETVLDKYKRILSILQSKIRSRIDA